jgi:hypothetical protein
LRLVPFRHRSYLVAENTGDDENTKIKTATTKYVNLFILSSLIIYY